MNAYFGDDAFCVTEAFCKPYISFWSQGFIEVKAVKRPRDFTFVSRLPKVDDAHVVLICGGLGVQLVEVGEAILGGSQGGVNVLAGAQLRAYGKGSLILVWPHGEIATTQGIIRIWGGAFEPDECAVRQSALVLIDLEKRCSPLGESSEDEKSEWETFHSCEVV